MHNNHRSLILAVAIILAALPAYRAGAFSNDDLISVSVSVCDTAEDRERVAACNAVCDGTRNTCLAECGLADPTCDVRCGADIDLCKEDCANACKEKVEDAQCKTKAVLDGLKAIRNGYLKQIVTDTINQFKALIAKYALQLIICNVVNFDKTVHIGAFGIGGDITFKGPNCSIDMGGEASAILQRNTIDKFENDFIARCIADSARKKAEVDARRIILENGPDGGPAYVTSWIDDIYVDEDQRGIRRFCAILANTDVCPYMRDYVYSYFTECPRSYFETPPDLTGLGARVDGGDSFVQQAQCTLPDGVTPERLSYDFSTFGGFQGLSLLMEPQNNPDGFIALAEEELATQRAVSVRAAEAEAIAGGGFRSLYGDAASSCINRDANGYCLALGPVRQPSGAVRDSNSAAIEAEFSWINSSDTMNTLMGDVSRRLTRMLLTIDELPQDYDIRFDASSQKYRDIGSGLKPPENLPVPEITTPTDPGDLADPLCTGGNPDCFCIKNDPQFFAIREVVAEATEAAIIQHPELVQPPGCVGNECSVIPGNEQLFLIAICETTVGESVECHPNAGSSDEVVVDAVYFSVSVDVLTSDGRARIPGQTIAACQPGIQ
jgi:hypothetical protein